MEPYRLVVVNLHGKVNFSGVVLVEGWLMVMLINSQTVASHFLFSSALNRVFMFVHSIHILLNKSANGSLCRSWCIIFPLWCCQQILWVISVLMVSSGGVCEVSLDSCVCLCQNDLQGELKRGIRWGDTFLVMQPSFNHFRLLVMLHWASEMNSYKFRRQTSVTGLKCGIFVVIYTASSLASLIYYNILTRKL